MYLHLPCLGALFPPSDPVVFVGRQHQGSIGASCSITSSLPCTVDMQTSPTVSSKMVVILVTKVTHGADAAASMGSLGPGFVAGLLDGLRAEGVLGIKSVSRRRRGRGAAATAATPSSRTPTPTQGATPAAPSSCWELEVLVEASSSVATTAGKQAGPRASSSVANAGLLQQFSALDAHHEVGFRVSQFPVNPPASTAHPSDLNQAGRTTAVAHDDITSDESDFAHPQSLPVLSPPHLSPTLPSPTG